MPERLVIEETARAAELLTETGVDVGGLIVNRVLPDDLEGEFYLSRKAQETVYLRGDRAPLQAPAPRASSASCRATSTASRRSPWSANSCWLRREISGSQDLGSQDLLVGL